MSDLIERLRRLYVQNGTNYVQEAADEIERLTAALRHEADCVEAAKEEIERLTAALHAQPGPVSMDDMEWAGKVHLAEAIRERDELRRQLDECSQMLARQAATIRDLTRPAGPTEAQIERLHNALVIAEAALADIGDADREPGDDLAWCEQRAAEALPTIRAALAAKE